MDEIEPGFFDPWLDAFDGLDQFPRSSCGKGESLNPGISICVLAIPSVGFAAFGAKGLAGLYKGLDLFPGSTIGEGR